jgi:glucose-1-phosphate thymidylyltransferase
VPGDTGHILDRASTCDGDGVSSGGSPRHRREPAVDRQGGRMKALVLAGGSGTRLRPFTYSMPKQLIPVANKPVLAHCLTDLRDAGVVEVGMIVNGRGPEIQAAIGDGADLGLRITYIHQEAPLGLAHCVQLARPFLGDADFVMYLGDNVLVGGMARFADEFRARRPAAQLLLSKVIDPREYGVAELDATGRVVGLQEKPPRPRSNLAVMGVYFFTPEVHEAVDRIRPSARGELEITDAIQWLVEHGRQVDGAEFTGYWKDTGRVDDVLECNRVLLGELTRDVRGEVDAASRIEGPVVIEPGAQVIRSRIDGPAIVGAGTVVEDSRVGPYTSLGTDCRLRDAEVRYSIALDHASVQSVRSIVGSIIGRSADVCSAPGIPTGHRLVIGDHTRVEVA